MKEYLEISSIVISIFIGVAILFSASFTRILEIGIAAMFISYPLFIGYKLFLFIKGRDGNNNKTQSNNTVN